LADRQPLAEIKANLAALELSVPSQADFLRLESQLIDAAPNDDLRKYLVNTKLKRTQVRVKFFVELLNKLQITPYFTKSYDFEKLINCRRKLETRMAIEVLALAEMPHSEIQELFDRRFDVGLTKTDLKIYLSFFFDTEEMEPADWNFHALTAESKEAKAKVVAIRESENIPMIKHLAGYDVKMDYLEICRDVYTSTYFRLKGLLDDSSSESVSRLNILSAVMTRAGDRYKKLEKPDEMTVYQTFVANIQNVNATCTNRPPVIRGALPELPPGEQKPPPLVVVSGGKKEEEKT
jgi:hypothetical protein